MVFIGVCLTVIIIIAMLLVDYYLNLVEGKNLVLEVKILLINILKVGTSNLIVEDLQNCDLCVKLAQVEISAKRSP